jgi:chaperone modulatory protein CbpM
VKMEKKKTVIKGIIVEETTISFIEVCNKYNLTEKCLIEMVEHGLFPSSQELQRMEFDRKTLARIRSARRLQTDLGLNIEGAVLVLELLEEMESLRNELHILRHHVDPFDKF